MWTPCMLRKDIVDGDMVHLGLRNSLVGSSYVVCMMIWLNF
jgi:hypothetical protein